MYFSPFVERLVNRCLVCCIYLILLRLYRVFSLLGIYLLFTSFISRGHLGAKEIKMYGFSVFGVIFITRGIVGCWYYGYFYFYHTYLPRNLSVFSFPISHWPLYIFTHVNMPVWRSYAFKCFSVVWRKIGPLNVSVLYVYVL